MSINYAAYLPSLTPVVYDRKTGEVFASASPEATPAPLKRCSRCRYSLPLSDFQKHAGRKVGLQDYCRVCQSRAMHAAYVKAKALKAPFSPL